MKMVDARGKLLKLAQLGAVQSEAHLALLAKADERYDSDDDHTAGFQPLPWMRFALQEVGQAETASKATNNPRILVYQKDVKSKADEEIPWCSAFANWCMNAVVSVAAASPTRVHGLRGESRFRSPIQ